MRRRSFIALAGAGVASMAGCSAITGDDGDSGPPVVGSEPADRSQTVRLEVRLTDDGDPVSGERVELHDPSGSYDQKNGTTGSNGRLVFWEGVGPAPCNSLQLRVPSEEVTVEAGCFNGNRTVEREIDLSERRG